MFLPKVLISQMHLLVQPRMGAQKEWGEGIRKLREKSWQLSKDSFQRETLIKTYPFKRKPSDI